MIAVEKKTNFIDSFSEEIWRTTFKYYKDDDVNDTFLRVATAIASVEKTPELQAEWTNKFYDLLTEFKATCGGRIYSNAGTDWKGTTLANCFVSPANPSDNDSLDGIIQSLRNQCLTLKSEGGWGHNFSILRPRGSFINGIGVETPGAVKFMELFNKSSEIITSGSGEKSHNPKAKGKIRKGAMMAVMDCWHPDAIEFIRAKQVPGRLDKFNISVNCTDDFMQKVLQVEELKQKKAPQSAIDQITWDFIFPDTSHPQYKQEWFGDIQDWKNKGYPVKVYRTVTVEWLWNLITESTYNRNEPGILFLDTANKYNPLAYKEHIASTNPCGEQLLAPAGICVLGSLNLTQFIDFEKRDFDYEKIKKYVSYLVRFLDNVNEYSSTPLPEYEYAMRNKRRIGMGVLGWASALYMMQIRFASAESAIIQNKLMETIVYTAIETSIDLAEEKGKFSLCEPEKHAASPYYDLINLPARLRDKMRINGIRNSSLFSIQPTGNTSIFAQIVSGGLEPLFFHEYTRTVIESSVPAHLQDVMPKIHENEFYETAFFKFAKEGDETILRGTDEFGTVYKIDKNRGLTREVLCQDYAVRYLKDRNLWDSKAPWAVTAQNLSVDDHIRDMSGFAKWLDSSCSKTINVPNNYSYHKFQNVYLNAYKTGFIKGITTYRAGTMTSVLSVQNDDEVIVKDVKMPDTNESVMRILRAENRKWYLTIVLNAQKEPFGLFVHTNSQEKSVTTSDAIEKLFALARKKKIPEKHIQSTEEKCLHDSNSTKIARSISLLLRHGVKIIYIVEELDKIETATVGSFLFQIKKFLASYIKNGEKVQNKTCSACTSKNIIYSEGCFKCVDCGSSKC